MECFRGKMQGRPTEDWKSEIIEGRWRVKGIKSSYHRGYLGNCLPLRSHRAHLLLAIVFWFLNSWLASTLHFHYLFPEDFSLITQICLCSTLFRSLLISLNVLAPLTLTLFIFLVFFYWSIVGQYSISYRCTV